MSSEENTRKKPCRVCTDFKTFSKSRGFNMKKKSVSINEVEKEPAECPVDREELGRNTWSFMHTMAAYYPDKPSASQQQDMTQFVGLFAKFFPCDDCAADLRVNIKMQPPEVESRHRLTQWFCRVHNDVNRKLGKPQFDCDRVDERWRDGWKDGSCD